MSVSLKLAATGLLDQMIASGSVPKGTILLCPEPLDPVSGCSSSWRIWFLRPDGSTDSFQMDISLPKEKLH